MITKKVYEQRYPQKYKPSTRGEFSNARVPSIQMAVGAFTWCITVAVRDENHKYFSIDS